MQIAQNFFKIVYFQQMNQWNSIGSWNEKQEINYFVYAYLIRAVWRHSAKKWLLSIAFIWLL